MLRKAPRLLIGFRLLAAFAMPLLAVSAPRWSLVGLFLLGVLSDVFDGILARRLAVDSLPLRRLDSRCDIIFALGAIAGASLATPSSAPPWFPWLWGYLALFALRNAVDYARYRASPSYHMWSGKIWAGVLFTYVLTALLGSPLAWLQPLAFCLYAINSAEGITASLILPRSAKDIPSIWHALQRRRSR